jgi:hypothetical protein
MRRAAKKRAKVKVADGRLSLQGPRGERVHLDLRSVKANAGQKAALQNLVKTGDLGALTPSEQNKISKLKYRIPSLPGDGAALIVRFDWKWVRIDEPADVGSRINPGPFKFSGRK